MNCTKLEVKAARFENYIDLLKNVTNDDLSNTTMWPCRPMICSTIYGTGNSDVSGIGVLVGYFVQFGLATILSLALLYYNWREETKAARSVRRATTAYAESTITFALSVELASCIMLIRKGFGLGAYEFGAFTVQLVWLVTILVMLPLLPFCWVAPGDQRFESRLCAMSLVLILFFINFVCRMVGTYSRGQVGTDVISEPEINEIQIMCYGHDQVLSAAGSMVVEVWSVGAALWILLNMSAALLSLSFDAANTMSVARACRNISNMAREETSSIKIFTSSLTMLSVPLFWGLMEMRSWQKAFAASLGEQSGTDVWSFGQILAVVVFFPVLTEIIQCYMERDIQSTKWVRGRMRTGQLDVQTQKTIMN